MLTFLLAQAMCQRAAVLLGTVVLAALGAWSALRLPMDAVPDITNPQVQINTAVPALAPEEVEKLVSFLIETDMAGLPGMVELRSLSKFGLSQITMIFHDGVDIYRTRQLVTERLQGVLDELPPGLTPRLAPIATGLGEIFYYTLDYTADAPGKPKTREAQLMELRTIHEYQVKPLLRRTPGVAEVNTSGGYQKQIVIQPDPARLVAAGMSLDELASKVEEGTRSSSAPPAASAAWKRSSASRSSSAAASNPSFFKKSPASASAPPFAPEPAPMKETKPSSEPPSCSLAKTPASLPMPCA
jgi:cobalt-zinc-cadmium resistance protein CzcA